MKLPQQDQAIIRHDAYSGVSGIRVLGVGGVAQPVHRFDAPLAAGDLREAGGAGLLRAVAGGVHDSLLISEPSAS
jgi:hypothetical protein